MMSDSGIQVETIRIHIGYKRSFDNGWIGLMFGFDSHEPLDIDVSWINTGEAAHSVVSALADICAEDPQKVSIDEEGESVNILPQVLENGTDMRLTFSTERRQNIPEFSVVVNRRIFIDTCKVAMKNFLDTEFQKSTDNKPAHYANMIGTVDELGN